MANSWAEIVRKPEYLSQPESVRKAVQRQYLKDVVIPKFGVGAVGPAYAQMMQVQEEAEPGALALTGAFAGNVAAALPSLYGSVQQFGGRVGQGLSDAVRENLPSNTFTDTLAGVLDAGGQAAIDAGQSAQNLAPALTPESVERAAMKPEITAADVAPVLGQGVGIAPLFLLPGLRSVAGARVATALKSAGVGGVMGGSFSADQAYEDGYKQAKRSGLSDEEAEAYARGAMYKAGAAGFASSAFFTGLGQPLASGVSRTVGKFVGDSSIPRKLASAAVGAVPESTLGGADEAVQQAVQDLVAGRDINKKRVKNAFLLGTIGEFPTGVVFGYGGHSGDVSVGDGKGKKPRIEIDSARNRVNFTDNDYKITLEGSSETEENDDGVEVEVPAFYTPSGVRFDSVSEFLSAYDKATPVERNSWNVKPGDTASTEVVEETEGEQNEFKLEPDDPNAKAEAQPETEPEEAKPVLQSAKPGQTSPQQTELPLPGSQVELDLRPQTTDEAVKKSGGVVVEPDEVSDDDATETLAGGMDIQEVPLEKLTVSKDVTQFKEGAGEDGVVEPLKGKYSRLDVSPIQVWERLDGSLEVISGRHRLALAKESGEKTIPAQIHREADGFNKTQAAILDAELNIRDEHGSIKDFARHFKSSGIDEQTATDRGLLSRAKGRAGWSIANRGSDALFTAFTDGTITAKAAEDIANAAPADEAMQLVGIKTIAKGKSINEAVNMMQAVRAAGGDGGQGDLFGMDDSALKEAEAMSRAAIVKQRGIKEQIAAAQGAAKNPKAAAKLGVDVKDPEAVKAKIAELKMEQQKWANWSEHSELVDALRSEIGVEPIQREPAPAEAPTDVSTDVSTDEQTAAPESDNLESAELPPAKKPTKPKPAKPKVGKPKAKEPEIENQSAANPEDIVAAEQEAVAEEGPLIPKPKKPSKREYVVSRQNGRILVSAYDSDNLTRTIKLPAKFNNMAQLQSFLEKATGSKKEANKVLSALNEFNEMQQAEPGDTKPEAESDETRINRYVEDRMTQLGNNNPAARRRARMAAEDRVREENEKAEAESDSYVRQGEVPTAWGGGTSTSFDTQTLDNINKKYGFDIHATNKVPPRSVRLARFLQRHFGRRVIFFEGDGPNGFYTTGTNTLYINVNSDTGYLKTMGHEFLHSIKDTDPDLYRAVLSAMNNSAFNEDATNEFKNDVKMRNKLTTGRDISEGQASEEHLADVFGALLTDPKFLTKLESQLTDSQFKVLLHRIADFLESSYRTLVNISRGSDGSLPDEARAHIEGTLDDMNRARGIVLQTLKRVTPYEVDQSPMTPEAAEASFSFAGMKSGLANKSKLREAITMRSNGATEKEIWQKTGWFRGDDSKWRYEIDDSKIVYTPIKDAISNNNGSAVMLSDVLDFPELFKAYPQLANLYVEQMVNPSSGDYGSYNYATKTIEISSRGVSRDQQLSTLLHEVQHAIQYIEAFSEGSSPGDMARLLSNGEEITVHMLNGAVDDAISDVYGAFSSALDPVFSEGDYGSSTLRRMSTGLISAYANGSLKNYAIESADSNGDIITEEQAQEFADDVNSAIEGFMAEDDQQGEALSEGLEGLAVAGARLEEADDALLELGFKATGKYRNTYGEVFPRVVQARHGMSKAERSLATPRETAEDIVSGDHRIGGEGTERTYLHRKGSTSYVLNTPKEVARVMGIPEDDSDIDQLLSAENFDVGDPKKRKKAKKDKPKKSGKFQSRAFTEVDQESPVDEAPGIGGKAKRIALEGMIDETDSFRRAQKFLADKLKSALPFGTDLHREVNLQKSKTSHKIADVRQSFNDFLKGLAKDGITLNAFDTFMYARHAEERNNAIDARRDDDRLAGKGSGMSTEDAKEILANIPKDKQALLEKHAAILDQINVDNLQRMLDSGLITQQQYDTVSKAYEHYVPLLSAELDTSMASQTGIRGDVRSRDLKFAFGRGSRAESPTISTFMQSANTYARGARAEIGRTLYNLAGVDKDNDLFEIVEPQMEGEAIQFDENGNMKVVGAKLPSVARQDIFVAKVNGEPKYIRIRSPAIRVAVDAMMHRNPDTPSMQFLSDSVEMVAKGTRFYSSVLTRYNPYFIPIQFARDAIGAATMGPAFGVRGRELLKEYPSSILGAAEYLSGVNTDSDEARMFQQFKDDGGMTSTLGLRDYQSYVDDLKKLGQRTGEAGVDNRIVAKENTKRVLMALPKSIELVNDIFENATRFSAYKVVLRKNLADGIPEEEARKRAALSAKEITVNFDRRGFWTNLMRPWIMFVNPAMQGLRAAGVSLKNPRVLQAGVGLFLVGALNAFLEHLLGGRDELSGRYNIDEQGEWKRDHYLTIGTGGEDAATMPIPYVVNIPYLWGRRVVKAMYDQSTDPLVGGLVATFDSISPVASASGKDTFAEAVLKSMTGPFKPFVEAMMNSSFVGTNIYPADPFNQKPDRLQYYAGQSTPLAVATSQALYAVFGNDRTGEAGWTDISPASIDHVVRSYTGGLGDLFAFMYNAATGSETRKNNWPIINKFFSEASSLPYSTDYHKALKNIYQVQDFQESSDGRMTAGERTALAAFKRSQSQIHDINKRMLHTDSEEQRKHLLQLIDNAQRRAIKAYDRRGK